MGNLNDLRLKQQFGEVWSGQFISSVGLALALLRLTGDLSGAHDEQANSYSEILSVSLAQALSSGLARPSVPIEHLACCNQSQQVWRSHSTANHDNFIDMLPNFKPVPM